MVPQTKDFFSYFPVPDTLFLSTCGLDLSYAAHKYIELKNVGEPGRMHIKSAGSAQNLNELGGMLVKAALPEDKAYLFTASIDRVPYESLRDAVAFILEENVPLKLAEAVFDFEIVKDVPSDNALTLAVTALPKTVIESYESELEGAQIKPVSFETESQALARAVVGAGDTRSYLLINLYEERTVFAVVANEVVQWSSNVQLGASGTSADLKTELRKTIIFWNTRLDRGMPSKKIEKIIISGPAAAKPNFAQELVNGLELEAVFADVWANVLPAKHETPNVSFEESLGFAVAVGAALPPRKKIYV